MIIVYDVGIYMLYNSLNFVHIIALSPRAAEWDLPNPNWRGRMRIIAKGDQCIVKLEDKISGE